MSLVDVEFGKVIIGKLDLRTVDDLEAHADEDVLDLVEDIVHRVLVAEPLRFCRQRNVDRLAHEFLFEPFAGQFGTPLLDRGFDLGTDPVRHLPHNRSLFGTQAAHEAQNSREFALFSQIADPCFFQLFHAGRLRDRVQRGLPQLLHLFFHVRLLKIKNASGPCSGDESNTSAVPPVIRSEKGPHLTRP